ncbi:hypothetical protein GGS23DRAFT_616370 [Durotheca rogersii]|uniref:uncharacterized protein n=1 Tax=Durotheca rogersii TaxID=419775 RepID=UPI00221FB955|nr:uncharacterized protein GGS23DRAFT_616370 [Durotheca rogersii]KAI5859263.1 hypothetical protein GGS23DRAFT_616370 [Durotheca rogersii]
MAKALLHLRQHSRSAITTRRASNFNSEQQPDRSLDRLLAGRVYIEELPPDIEPIRTLLVKYSGIRTKDVDEHVHQIRDRLWDIYPYATIGHFRFLSLKFTLDSWYHVALDRLLAPRSDVTFLDVGCCVGQVLRKLAFDGVDPGRLYGLDLESRFIDAGYDLFKDRNKFRATFLVDDVLRRGSVGGGDSGSEALDGKINIIHATSFFHLFTWRDQVRAAQRMVQFLDPDDPDAMIFGRQVGTTTPGDKECSRGPSKFLHNAVSWQALWDEVGVLTGTSWRTEVSETEERGMRGDETADGTLRRIRFGVFRA